MKINELSRTLILSLLVLLMISCTKKKQNKANQEVTTERIIGAWGNDENGNAIFQIDKDSILYVDPLTKYKYTFNHDTLFMYQDDIVNKLLVLRVDNDSMIIRNLNYSVIQRYNRRK